MNESDKIAELLFLNFRISTLEELLCKSNPQFKNAFKEAYLRFKKETEASPVTKRELLLSLIDKQLESLDRFE